MANSDCSKEEMFEALFQDRFTEKDVPYCELKSKPLSAPTVVYPWKFKKQWFKSWDYSRDRHNRDRNRSRYDRDNYSRDRSQDAESSQYRDRRRDGQDSYRQRRDDRSWNRDEDRDNRRNYHRDRD